MEKGIRTRLTGQGSVRELRDFGLIIGLGCAVIFGTVLPLMHHRSAQVWPWAIAIALALVALIAPRLLYYPRRAWQALGRTLGWVNGQIISSLLFYVIFSPAGALARAFGWDPMERRFEPRRPSYRPPSAPIAPESMEHPYYFSKH